MQQLRAKNPVEIYITGKLWAQNENVGFWEMSPPPGTGFTKSLPMAPKPTEMTCIGIIGPKKLKLKPFRAVKLPLHGNLGL